MTGSVGFVVADGVATVTLSNPARRNAITMPMYAQLETIFRDVTANADIRVVVLRGADGAFAGGTDIAHLREISSGARGVEYEAYMRRVQQALIDVAVPVVAVVDGACVGGGIVFAALSDIVLCTPGSRFGSPIARTIGNTLSPTSIARLSETFGRRAAAEMLYTARLFSADEALRAGFVNDVLESPALEKRVDDIVTAIRSGAPRTIGSFRLLWRRVDAALGDIERDDVYADVYASRDFAEGVDAFFAKRPPAFTGE